MCVHDSTMRLLQVHRLGVIPMDLPNFTGIVLSALEAFLHGPRVFIKKRQLYIACLQNLQAK